MAQMPFGNIREAANEKEFNDISKRFLIKNKRLNIWNDMLLYIHHQKRGQNAFLFYQC